MMKFSRSPRNEFFRELTYTSIYSFTSGLQLMRFKSEDAFKY